VTANSIETARNDSYSTKHHDRTFAASLLKL